MSTDDVKNYKLQARLPVAPKSPLKGAQPTQTIRVAKRTVPRAEGTADVKPAMRPPSVGKLIERRKTDPDTGEVRIVQRFKQTGYLGKGGFAKVYAVIELESQEIFAAKVIAKSSLVKRRTKEKLASEIRIHAMLRHKHIVKYVTFFEDSTSCYILMELCNNKSLADLIKTRKRLTEGEARYYMFQLLEAVSYMHSKRVIHRDLKLGNIFLNDDLHIKIGDFGLATRLQHDNDRRRTLCGTPNYIAPEILERGDNGHSYEADIWSIGVIMYTLLIGKPPFETNKVETTYKRIKDNDYTFPEGIEIPSSAKKLIRRILTPTPELRPTLQEIMDDEFFTSSFIPHSLPLSALSSPPTLSPSCASSTTASNNPRYPLTDTTNTLAATAASATKERRVEDIIAEAKAQIALANKPVVTVPVPSQPAVRTSPHIVTSPTDDLADIFHSTKKPKSQLPEQANEANCATADAMVSAADPSTRKRLRSPFRNAGIADKSPTKQRPRRSQTNVMSTCKRLIDDFEEKEERKEVRAVPAKRFSTQALVAVETVKVKEAEGQVQPLAGEGVKKEETKEAEPKKDEDREDELDDVEEPDERVTVRVHRTLTESFARLTMNDRTEAHLDGLSRAPFSQSVTNLNSHLDIKAGNVCGEDETSPVCWVRKWFDITDRYGLAYQLQDGSIGGFFNDRTTILRKCVEPDTGNGWKMENDFIYISYKRTRRGKRQHRERYSMDKFPQELFKKVQLLKYFQKLFDKENKSTSTLVEAMPEDARSAQNPVLHVDRWFRRKHATFFRLSNRIVQVNFTDESKVILSSDGKMVTYVDKQGAVHVHTLDAIVLNPNPSIVNRLKYTRDILDDVLHPREAGPKPSDF